MELYFDTHMGEITRLHSSTSVYTKEFLLFAPIANSIELTQNYLPLQVARSNRKKVFCKSYTRLSHAFPPAANLAAAARVALVRAPAHGAGRAGAGLRAGAV